MSDPNHNDNEHGRQCLTRDDAKLIVRETLEAIGVDMDHPIEFQADARFLRRLRKTHDTIGAKALATMVGVIVTGTIALVVMGVAAWTKGGGQ